MQYDYYAFRKERLSNPLNELEQAAKEVTQLEPHLAYLWFWAKKEENDKEPKQAKQVNNRAEEKEASKKAKLNSESANSIRDAWKRHLAANSIPSEFQFLPKLSDLDRLPSLSFMLHIPFKLRKPYLSKDDRAFHLLDNPVRKDKVFQTPMVASTSWKGALHNAIVQHLAEWWCNLDEPTKHSRSHRKEFVAKRVSLARLFGTEKGVQIDDKKLDPSFVTLIRAN